MMSSISEIPNRLSCLSIPIAYRAFNAPAIPPFICYITPTTKTEGADNNTSILLLQNATVELYSKFRNFKLENKIASIFNDVELSISSEYIESEQMYVTYFEFEFFCKN